MGIQPQPRSVALSARIVHSIASDPAGARPKALAYRLGAHVGSVRRVLRRLERAGLISRIRRHGPWAIVGVPGHDSCQSPTRVPRRADRRFRGLLACLAMIVWVLPQDLMPHTLGFGITNDNSDGPPEYFTTKYFPAIVAVAGPCNGRRSL